jgi:hypothetical protein
MAEEYQLTLSILENEQVPVSFFIWCKLRYMNRSLHGNTGRGPFDLMASGHRGSCRVCAGLQKKDGYLLILPESLQLISCWKTHACTR